jgi:hypothetical protein
VCVNTAAQSKASVELADIFRQHGAAFVAARGVSTAQHRAINAIQNCRTAALGGHVACCDICGIETIAYNSCRTRHCPKCQSTSKLRWLEKSTASLLPVQYFHVVFTIPHELNGLASYNAQIIYNLLFKAAWSTVNLLGQDKKRLGGTMGMQAFLHTWGQNLSQHIHLHCMIPGGALAEQNGKTFWRACKPGFLFPVKVMSKLFGKIFLGLLVDAYQAKQFIFNGVIAEFSELKKFESLVQALRKKSWNVYAKAPFNGAQGGLEYLARYVNKTAISNERILSFDDEHVAFKWRDYADQNRSKIMKLEIHEFIRRFLTHVLPKGFMRVRSFGFLANPIKARSIEQILTLLAQPKEEKEVPKNETTAELIKRVVGIDIELCKHCKKGRLHIIKRLPNFKQSRGYLDTS